MRRTFIVHHPKSEDHEDVEDDNITHHSFMIIPLELIFVQIVGRHGNCTFIASDSFSFIVSYGYLFAGHVIIDNFSFANVEIYIGILGSLAFASVFIDILASTCIVEGFNVILGNVIIAIAECDEKKCDTDIETNHKWSA